MGCCCPSTERGWTERHDIVLDFMRGDGYLQTVWSAFKLNDSAHESMEYDEFCALIFIALEIYDKIHEGTSRKISNTFAMTRDDLELATRSKYKHKGKTKSKADGLDEMPRNELNRRDNIDQIQATLDIIAPQLAVQFDKDGDGVFSWDEFKELGKYLKDEYTKITSGYQAPQTDDDAAKATLLERT
mmetsp:Transcript_41364/g.66535  ORF Transcript_41364/g.66535 Transcript_41364/m.66535 type:complete len:187 (+) Transcript_41364:475-1035(+)